jgi:GTPase SAR1 family protein
MATLRDIKATSVSMGLEIATKHINFLHKHQGIAPDELAGSYQTWFSEEPTPELLAQLISVIQALPKADQVEVIAEDPMVIEPEVEINPQEIVDQVAPEQAPEDQLVSEQTPPEQDVAVEPSLVADPEPVVAAEPAVTEEQVLPPAPPVQEKKPFTPWWSDSQGDEASDAISSENYTQPARPDVTEYLDVTRRLEDDRFELIQLETTEQGLLTLSWSPIEGNQTYVLCTDTDHYPFEVTVDNAASIGTEPSAKYQGPDTYFTVFAFSKSGAKGFAWAKGRFVADVEWFSADVVDGKVSLRWSEIPAGLDLRVAKSLPDQRLVDVPTANFWLPVSAKSNGFVDEKVELGKNYEYRAYLEWVGADKAVHASPGIAVAVNVLVDFPKALSFEAKIDDSVSGKVICHVEGVNVPEYVQIFEVDGLPSNELLAALSDKRQLHVSELNHLKTRSWLGQSLLGMSTQTATGVQMSTVLSNASRVSKSFVLVLTLGSVAQVTAVSSVQRVGEILSAELIEKFDYQLIRLDQPQGAQSLDIWMVAASVPFDQIAHTPPNRRVLIQEEYLRYGGILFADKVPNKPQIRRLAPSPQTIYIRGASTFEGVTEFGSVVQVNYPGRIKLAYMVEPEKTEPEAKAKSDASKPKKEFSWPWKKKPKAALPAAPSTEPKENIDAPVEQTEAARPTNKTIDSIGSKLIGESKYQPKPNQKAENFLKKFLGALTGKKRAKKVQAQPQGPRVLLRVDGTEPTHNLNSISALHFAGNTFPLDEHDCTVPKAPLELKLMQNRGSFQPHKIAVGKDGEPVYLRLEANLQHRFQIQCETPGDSLRGVRCFSIDGSVEQEIGKRVPAPLGDIELSVAVLGSPGSGKSTFLAALTHYLQDQYELLVRAEVIEGEESSGSLRAAAKQLSIEGKLPKRARPITGSEKTPTSSLSLVSKSPVPIRKLNFVDTSGIDFESDESIAHVSDELLRADLLVITVDPTRNVNVSGLASGIVAGGEEQREADEPFWLLQRIVKVLSENQGTRNPNQRVAVCLTKFDAMEIASDISGTSLSGTIRSGMSLARDPHMLWDGEYLESFGSLQDREVRALLSRVSGYGPFLKLVDDTFQSGEVRYFAISALGRSNFSETLGGGGLTSVRISDPIRWAAREVMVKKSAPAASSVLAP